ncbi:predicted protein [Nematostella vectensis]|uniref:Uncharacterized protein n=2 Tax=Nematostella vectensis TaxID=45351 RepID=A7RRD2_NEMVE|nr:predicted protein [Nematostella vectensis]|eukprot:XP_001638056.1 predicted protein [Nematostella vectensis]
MMSEISSKVMKGQGASPEKVQKPSPGGSGQAPAIVLNNAGYASDKVTGSSEESLQNQLLHGTPSISIEPPSDGSRPSTSSPPKERKVKSEQSKKQNKGVRSNYLSENAAVAKTIDSGRQNIVSSIGELDDDSDGEELVAVAKPNSIDNSYQQDIETPRTSSVKKKTPTREDSPGLESEQDNICRKKKKKKRSKTPEAVELPPLTTRGRPLPALGSYGREGDSNC